MTTDAELRCRCGEVRGHVRGAAPETANHMFCYCDDCQAYLHHLGRTDLLDGHGGTDIVQVAPAALSFDAGVDRIVGLRLTPRGLHRWYASCCKTPVGNTFSVGLPFVGVVAQAFDNAGNRASDVFGKAVGAAGHKSAVGGLPDGLERANLRLILRAVRLVAGWRLRGKTWPHPFFDRATRQPIRPVSVLSRAEREALRPLCGPHPAAPAS
ncbi:MAG TPA: DUF6151 family protein [Polyangiaceae bacterium]|nr:DUF6151 family protein [Polyangiaceae bacterium]